MTDSEPTQAALATRAFLAEVDNRSFRQVIETRAKIGGWAGARKAGLWEGRISDSVAMGALDAIWDLLRGWAAECEQESGADALDRERR